MSKSGTTIRYEYNHNGLRTQKFVDTNNKTDATYYTYNGKNIIHVIKNSDHLHIFYDAQNRPAKVSHNGIFYTYLYNLQGDVVGLLDKNSALVVEYKYDAWGKPLSITGTLAATLGKLNPFRYRGYVYDEETGLYYLRSRYYNAGRGRFVNSDTLITQHKHAGKHNLFAYCNNAPTLARDPDGRGIGLLVVVLIVAAGALSGCSINKSNSNVVQNSQYNCYAHALRKKEWQHVGAASKTAVKRISDIAEVKAAVLKDNESRGIRVLSSVDEVIADNEYRIALRTGCEVISGQYIEDYHFMRQDEDGTWSHKPGSYEILYLGEDVTPDDVTWDLLYTDGSVAFTNFYSSETVYFAIQYE